MIKTWLKRVFFWSGSVATLTMISLASPMVSAQSEQSGFSVQVTPSPLVATIQPGVQSKLELKVKNIGTSTDTLKIETRSFKIDEETGAVDLSDNSPAEIADWISYSDPTFTIKPGEWQTQEITIDLPADTGFSYSFAFVISRTVVDKAESGNTIAGSVAIFTLLNVDRPGAVRKLEVTSFKATQSFYEYLPVRFKAKFKNTGNVIVQPFGNVFIQRGSSDAESISTLPVNDVRGYIIPGSSRVIDSDWADGFPVYETVVSGNEEKEDLNWDWSKLTDFRIGQYTAKLIAVYNDGMRDVPIERTATFWVFPWRIALVAFAVFAVFAAGIVMILRKLYLAFRRGKSRKSKSNN